jgi:hypothetical protein
VTDFMSAGKGVPGGMIYRLFSAPPDEALAIVRPRPDYARQDATLTRAGNAVTINDRQRLYASHAPTIEGNAMRHVARR